MGEGGWAEPVASDGGEACLLATLKSTHQDSGCAALECAWRSGTAPPSRLSGAAPVPAGVVQGWIVATSCRARFWCHVF